MKDIITKLINSAVIMKIKTFIKTFDAKRLAKETREKISIRKGKKKKHADKGLRSEFILYRKPKSPIAEAYRMLRTNIQYSGTGKELKSVVVTSSGPREGKTTTVVNLGCAFAQANKKTLIVDSDLRNTSFHRLFKLNNDFGLTSVILGEKKVDEVIYRDVLMPNLDIITSGPKVINPSEIIGSGDATDFINTMKTLYDIVLFDSPPTLAVTDAKLLSFNMEGVIMVVQSSKMAREVARKAMEGLKEINANIIGVVLNNLDTTKEHYYYYHRYYYSYYAKEDVKEKPPSEEKLKEKIVTEQKPKVEQKKEVIKKKDLFIPDTPDKETNKTPPPAPSDGIISMLSKEEKKEAKKKMNSTDRKSPDKNSALGKKTIFFKEEKKSARQKKSNNKEDEGKSGLGKKDIFKDLDKPER